MLGGGLLGRVDRVLVVDPVLSITCRFGRVQAGLGAVSRRLGGPRERGTHLDQILPLGLGDQRLQLGGGEGVDQPRLGDDEQEDLRARQDGQFVCLWGG